MTVAAAEVLGFKHTFDLLMKKIISCCKGSRAALRNVRFSLKFALKLTQVYFFFPVFFLYKDKKEICILGDIMFAFGLTVY